MILDTKSALLDCAEAVVRARGFDGFSYADLAEAVGIRKASIHYHFPTKANLTSAVMQRYHERFEAICGKIDAQNASAAERLAAMVAVYRSALKDGEAVCLCVALIGGKHSLSDEVVQSIKAFRTMMLEWFAKTFDKARSDRTILHVADSTTEGHAMLALIEGAQLAARAGRDPALFDNATRLALDRCVPVDAV